MSTISQLSCLKIEKKLCSCLSFSIVLSLLVHHYMTVVFSTPVSSIGRELQPGRCYGGTGVLPPRHGLAHGWCSVSIDCIVTSESKDYHFWCLLSTGHYIKYFSLIDLLIIHVNSTLFYSTLQLKKHRQLAPEP